MEGGDGNAAVQFNLRIKKDTLTILKQIAKEMNLTASSFGAKIITDYVEFYNYKIQRGDVTLSQPILKTIFEAVDPKKISQISKNTASHIISEIKAQEGEITYDVLIEHFLKWNKGLMEWLSWGTRIMIRKSREIINYRFNIIWILYR